MVLLKAQIPHWKPRTAKGTEQLVAVVAEGLQPLGMAGAHAEHPCLQRERLAMGRQQLTGDARPGLPKGGEVAVAFPLPLQGREAIG
jgi:hypothetical protein